MSFAPLDGLQRLFIALQFKLIYNNYLNFEVLPSKMTSAFVVQSFTCKITTKYAVLVKSAE
jgi:hypothetical protein